GARSPCRLRYPRLAGDLGEVTAVIAEEVGAAVSREQEIGIAIVVIVGDSHSHPIAIDRQSHFPGHVPAFPAALIMVEGRIEGALPVDAGEAGGVAEEEVGASVTVATAEGTAGTQGLGREGAATLTIRVSEVAACRLEHLDE